MKSKCTIHIILCCLLCTSHAGCTAQETVTIKGKVDGIESGRVYLMEITTGDTIGSGQIDMNQYVVDIPLYSGAPSFRNALLQFQQMDNRTSISIPVIFENASIEVSYDAEGFGTYAGTPVQKKFNLLVREVSKFDNIFQNRTSGVVLDSAQNALGSILEKFYLENADSIMGPFLSMFVADFLDRKLIDPNGIPRIAQACDSIIDPNDKAMNICEAIARFDKTHVGLEYIQIVEKRHDGSTFDLSEIIGDKIVILDFWASWCGPCLLDMPALKTLYERDDIEIIGISIDRNTEPWQRKLNQLGLPWINIRDTKVQIAKAYGVISIPTKFVIDKKGIVVSRNPERLDDLLNEIAKD